jgi:DNA polymerase III subunit epsilon
MREIVLDTETTGLDPLKGDRIIEIGAIELFNHVPTGIEFHRYINPGRDVPAEAVAVHGLTTEFLRPYPAFAAVASEFMEFIADSNLIIHNASFDVGFINAELAALGRAPLGFGRVTDTLKLARQKFPMSPASLDALCRRFGVDTSRRDKHGAIVDSQLLAQVYLELIGGRQAALTLATVDTKRSPLQQSGQRLVKRERQKPLAPRLTDAEKQSHAEHVASLGPNTLWPSGG